MTPRVRTAIQRIEQAFEAQNWDHPTLLTDAHELAQYAKQAHATIGGGDTAISQRLLEVLEAMVELFEMDEESTTVGTDAWQQIMEARIVIGEARGNPVV